jgi:hypothetical protein
MSGSLWRPAFPSSPKFSASRPSFLSLSVLALSAPAPTFILLFFLLFISFFFSWFARDSPTPAVAALRSHFFSRIFETFSTHFGADKRWHASFKHGHTGRTLNAVGIIERGAKQSTRRSRNNAAPRSQSASTSAARKAAFCLLLIGWRWRADWRWLDSGS